MLPTLVPGERVTALWRLRPLRSGDIVVVRSPRDSRVWLIKRCQLTTRGRVALVGDNPDYSTDSREFGDLARRSVRWVVLRSSIAAR